MLCHVSPPVGRTLPSAAAPCQWMCPVLHSTQQKGEQMKAKNSTWIFSVLFTPLHASPKLSLAQPSRSTLQIEISAT